MIKHHLLFGFYKYEFVLMAVDDHPEKVDPIQWKEKNYRNYTWNPVVM